MAIIRAFRGRAPRVDPTAYVADGCTVVGDVELGPGASIWFGTVVRGDVNHVRIGARSNLQDGSVVHVTSATHPTVLGDDVTVGHRVVRAANQALAGELLGPTVAAKPTRPGETAR